MDAITSYDETIRDLQKKKEAFYAKLLSVAATLTNLRQDAAKEIEAAQKRLY